LGDPSLSPGGLAVLRDSRLSASTRHLKFQVIAIAISSSQRRSQVEAGDGRQRQSNRGRRRRPHSLQEQRLMISDLWISKDPTAWDDALKRYWSFVQPRNLDLEKSLDALDIERIRCMDPRGWYDFLRVEYFRWKYTAPNRYATTTRRLQRYADDGKLDDLDRVRQRLLALDTDNIRSGLKTASLIHGLGTAGASGLIALMYSQKFGTVDQFAVKALRQVGGLPEAEALARMNPDSLTISDGVLIIGVFRRKAADLNRIFKSAVWTPRKLDMVLWTFGR
jgi:hypothetical protein